MGIGQISSSLAAIQLNVDRTKVFWKPKGLLGPPRWSGLLWDVRCVALEVVTECGSLTTFPVHIDTFVSPANFTKSRPRVLLAWVVTTLMHKQLQRS